MASSRTDALVALPRPTTSLIGRQQELNHLYELLRSDAALVTITGFGGIGKTRLALQAALELEPFFDAGAIFAPLAAISNGNSIPRAIALIAGLDDSIDAVGALASSLGSSSRLLVLDNLEQIPDAADMVMQLLQAMPNVTILATSRSRLELGGEYVLPLEPLETRSGDIRSLPAVQLFIERGRAVDPSISPDSDSLEIIGEICQKLDGIPLAIELAAARLAIFSLADLHHQLDHILPVLASRRVDMPDRQRTMRNAIAWTYELLNESERRLFTWLSVYKQDFSLESIAHVARQLELTDDPLDLVQFLVGRSLIRPRRHGSGSPRYHMLQMLREFGHEQLLATSEDHLARRSHAMDMVHLAERAEPHFLTATGKRWTLLLQHDIANLLSAMEWCSQNNHDELNLRIIGSTWRFADTNGFRQQYLAVAPQEIDGSVEPHIRAQARVGIGYLNLRVGNIEAAESIFHTALDLSSRLADQAIHVAALCGHGAIALARHDLNTMEDIYTRARALAEEIGDPRGLTVATGQLASCYLHGGKTSEAIPILKKLIAHVQQRGDVVSETAATGNLAMAYQMEERLEEAEKYELRAIELGEQTGNIFGLAGSYANLSGIYLEWKDYDRCLELIEKGLVYARQSGFSEAEWNLLSNRAQMEAVQGNRGAAAREYAVIIKMMTGKAGLRELIAYASDIMELAYELELLEESAELIGAIRAGREELKFPPYPWREEIEQTVFEQLNPKASPKFTVHFNRGVEFTQEELCTRMVEICELIERIQPPTEPRPVFSPTPAYSLTPRESEVLEMLCRGLTNAEIAEELFLSTRTVTTHLSNIFAKLDVNNRTKAIAVATQAGLV